MLHRSYYSFVDLSADANKNLLFRDNLFQKLDDYMQTSGSWVFGPAGTGKTTLISTYLQKRKLSSIVFNADTFGSDVETFFATISQALENSGLITQRTATVLSCPDNSPS